MSDKLSFTAYCVAAPQGSSKAFVIKGKAQITGANKNTMPYRQHVAQVAMLNRPDGKLFAGKHVPVAVTLDFYYPKPPSIPKRRKRMVVKPDIDKLARSTFDAMTGIIYHDDAQIVELTTRKHYDPIARVEITIERIDEE